LFLGIEISLQSPVALFQRAKIASFLQIVDILSFHPFAKERISAMV
jgi:hypothetical protein